MNYFNLLVDTASCYEVEISIFSIFASPYLSFECATKQKTINLFSIHVLILYFRVIEFVWSSLQQKRWLWLNHWWYLLY